MKFERILSNLLVMLVGLGLSLLGAEWLFRTFSPVPEDTLHGLTNPVFYRPHPYSMFKGTPGASFGWVDRYGQDIRFNERGYRGDVPSTSKPKGEFRLFVLGGSTILGAETSIPNEIQKYFNKSDLKFIKVFNYGVSASNSSQDLMRLIHEVLREQPDYVIFYEGANDFENPYYGDPRVGFPYNFMVTEANPIYKRRVSEYPLWPTLLYSSAIMRHYFQDYFSRAFFDINQLRLANGYRTNAWRQSIIDELWHNFAVAHDLLKSRGVGFAAFFQPMIYYKDQRSHEEQANLNSLVPDGLKEMTDLRDRFRKKAKDPHSFPFYDLSEVFNRNSERVFNDTVHVLEDKSDRFLAEQIIEKIRNQLPMSPQTNLTPQRR